MSFEEDSRQRVALQAADAEFVTRARKFMESSIRTKYSYNFFWLGLPIIQYPQDMVAMQELVWRLQPDVIVETGVARGGSLVFYASLLELIGKGRVIGIDVDIRSDNRQAILAHPLSRRIDLVDGSSTAPSVIAQVEALAGSFKTGLVVLDSNHTHDHVLAELQLYARFVTVGSYCVVMDTVVEDLPAEFYSDRPWSVGDNPKTAVCAFLDSDNRFVSDDSIPAKLGVTVAPSGYLRRVA